MQMEKTLNTPKNGSSPEGRIMQGYGEKPSALQASAGDDDHRNRHRRRTLKQGRVVLAGSTVIDCKLRDMSEDGAHLVFGGAISLPDEFKLYNVSDKLMVRVKLAWQRGLEAGVSFTGPAVPHSDF
jgi:hypothetical protein